jgi:hypothetical protein
VGRGSNPALRGRGKDIVSFGNGSDDVGSGFEVWLDELAVGRTRLPWARRDDPHRVPRPFPLEPDALPERFSFVFGSCHVSSRVPYTGTALEAAARVEPDFFVHLGDFCYPDTGAYAGTAGGYQALWTDLLYEDSLAELFRQPWIYVASDHDLGGNNVDRESLFPHAVEAFAAWQRNDRSVDAEGRFGAIPLDRGRILLLWLDEISRRDPLDAPDGPSKTMLGSRQKRWLLRTLRRSRAKLIIVLSQTSFGHASDTGWARYTSEQNEVLAACRDAAGLVRWLSGDHHTARWARISDRIVEWGAAPFAEVPQGKLPPLPFVVGDECLTPGNVPTRASALATLTRRQLEDATSFGRVVVDTRRGVARFDVRDNRGRVRVAPSGVRLSETIRYA